MNKATIISKVRELDFDVNEYWVIAGAALVLHGLRAETADIDLACTKKLFCELLLQGYTAEKNELDYRKISLEENIEIFEEWNVDGIIFIDDIPTANLEGLKEMKIKMGRAKDIQDLKLIEEAQRRMEKV
jgi:hypothetical protein